MKTKILLLLAVLATALAPHKSNAAPIACVDEMKWSWQLDEDNEETLYQPAAYQCKELADLDKRVDAAIVYAETTAALSACTGQLEATVLLAGARAVLGITKITIRNLPCEDGPKIKAEAVEAACGLFAARGIPCKAGD